MPLVPSVYLFFNILLYLLQHYRNSLQGTGNQPIAEIRVEEGKDVKLSCTLQKISDTSYLYWYRQVSRNAPVFILQSVAGKDNKSPDFPDRFSSKVDKSNEDFKLSIVTVLIMDSAMYYCAKEPTLPRCYGRSGPVQKHVGFTGLGSVSVRAKCCATFFTPHASVYFAGCSNMSSIIKVDHSIEDCLRDTAVCT
uniref:Ig-like domain-containing protein n=1 Tax=Callorhinchus milii TaxID=7868 RepID=A0A4W3GBW0_CALMI